MTEVLYKIVQEEGWAGLFKGWWSQVVALGCSNFIYFYMYNMLKVIVIKKTGVAMAPSVNLTVGAVAGVVNVLLTSPLWMISTQLAVQAKNAVADPNAYQGIWDGLVKCYKSEGIEGLWKGVGPNLALVSNPTIHFFVYERVRMVMSKIAESRKSPITSLEFFCMGAFAKAVATVLTYPVQIAQSQLRNDRKSPDGKRKYKDSIDCLTKIYQQAGLGGWFRGMNAKLWQTVLTAAFQFMTYEKMRVLVFFAITGKELRVRVGGH